jgi:hypothetical protein
MPLAPAPHDLSGATDPELAALARDSDRAALGDVNGDGILDVFSIAAFNGGPRTALYNGADVPVARAANRNPVKLVGDFFAAPSGADEGRGGRSIAVGDVNGDRVADLIVTGDNLLGTGNQVVIFSGADLIAAGSPGSAPPHWRTSPWAVRTRPRWCRWRRSTPTATRGRTWPSAAGPDSRAW